MSFCSIHSAATNTRKHKILFELKAFTIFFGGLRGEDETLRSFSIRVSSTVVGMTLRRGAAIKYKI